MADINVGNNANLLKGAIDSHDTQINNTDNHIDNSVTNNVVNNTSTSHNVFEAQKSVAQMHADNVQTFLGEVIRLVESPDVAQHGGMLSAQNLHDLAMLRLRLMLTQQEADGIIAQVQQSYVATRQAKQREQAAKQMAGMAPPINSSPSMNKAPQMPTLPQFNAQSVQLQQMQGFNALQAAQQMGLGSTQMQMPPLPQMCRETNALGAPNGMPQMCRETNALGTPNGMPPLPPEPSTSPNGYAPLGCSDKDTLIIPDNSPTQQPERVPQYGIIFTDSLTLAEKYGCSVEDVYEVLNVFITNSAKIGQNWYLLDAGNCRQELGNAPYWGDYNDILSSFIHDNGFQVGIATPVFIIGGSDVIPVPQLENPHCNGMIPTDMAYCFSTLFFSDLWDGDRHISNDYVRNTVSRLPLECGKMQTALQDDLLSYFNLCSVVPDGIEIEGVAMASNVEWTDNSVTMSQHLPLIYTKTSDEQETYKRMYMCPKLVATESGNGDVDEKVLNDYEQALSHAGMLLFNLHGSDSKRASGFYCNGDDGYPESFNINMMKQSNARVLNTVACFGARYDGYTRENSMLMSALLGGGKLLYAGSTISVPMIGDENQTYPEGVTQYPGSGSEKFMPIYCYYQFCGLPAGQAMMQAKLDYFNTFRHIERDDFSLSTIMMFGLYGNPMLHVRARQDVMDAAVKYEVLPQLPETAKASAPIRMKRTQCLITKQQLQESKSLLDQLRSCVDDNLRAIHGMVQQYLYQQLGLDPRWLDEVDVFTMPDGNGNYDMGYIYNYDDCNKFGNKTMVEVDRQGQITRKITFK